MPYKNKKKHAAYMRNWRKKKKEQAKGELLSIFTENEIKIKLPTVHELVFGKPERERRKKKSEKV